MIAEEITNDTPDPLTVREAHGQSDWPKWDEAINSELNSLIRRQVFGPIVPIQAQTNYTDYRFTFTRKRNAQGEVVRYKARLVAKGYTQIFGRDYDLTCSPVIDSITYRYMIIFALFHKLKMHLMDVVMAYLYGVLDTKIYMKAPPKLISRAAFHIKGEKTNKLQPDLQSGIKQMTPTKASRN
jgi:hypothetical protein